MNTVFLMVLKFCAKVGCWQKVSKNNKQIFDKTINLSEVKQTD